MMQALLLLACLGHLVLMVGTHNWFYGGRWSKQVGDVMHLVHALVVLAFPILVLVAFGWRMTALFDWEHACLGQRCVQVYLGVCLLTAGVWLPVLTYWRLTRSEPAQDVRVEVVDVARQLGRRPVGDGHHAFLARLPGNEIFQVEYIEKTLLLPRLPEALEGLTVLHLSDLHLHGTPERAFFDAIIERCAAWNPDLVAITGDIADSPTHYRWIIPVLGRLRWRQAAVAILGNHDFRRGEEPIRRRLRRLGMHVPGNSWFELSVRGEKILVIGHEGPWKRPAPNLADCPRGPFRLCLSHTPDNIGWARRHGIDLMLSGHVHGGQIRVPIVGSIFVPSRLGRRHDAGTYHVPPTVLHVSRGVSGEHPVRYNCRPEVTLLTLRRGKAEATECPLPNGSNGEESRSEPR